MICVFLIFTLLASVTKYLMALKSTCCSEVNNKMVMVLLTFIRKLYGLNKLKISINIIRNRASLCRAVPHYLCFSNTFEDDTTKSEIINEMKVIDDFVTESEENSLLEELEPYLKRMRYERGHWDNAIQGFRETERHKWNSSNTIIIDKLKKLAFDSNSVPLSHVHVLDLEENGVIMPHIDSVKFCGTTIAGISLLSDSVMRLTHDKDKTKIVDVLLKRRSLYIMTGSARYLYTHEILGNNNSTFNGKAIKKCRRISVICRNEP